MYRAKTPCCRLHYGGREIKIFRGPVYNQKGAGFFGDMFRKLVPLLTTRVLPYVGKRVAETGEDVVENLRQGATLKEAIKKSAKRTFNRGKSDILRKLKGEGKTHKKKRKRRDYFSV